MIDLHTHSYYSDGRASPRELLAHARRIGLSALAISDHNNGRGAREAQTEARDLGVTLIPAIEWYVRWSGYTGMIDVLTLGIDLHDPHVLETECAAVADLEAHIAESCHYFTDEGYPVTMDEVRAVNERFAGHVQLAQALVRQGRIADLGAIDPLWKRIWPRIPPPALDITDVIRLAHDTGGVAVVAHAHQYKRNGANWSLKDLAALQTLGLDGIEVFHRRMQGTDRTHFMGIAEKLGMLMTGGSDEHGWPEGFPYMGVEPVSDALLPPLLARLGCVDAH
ncbi:MAG: PHP domain-containing protein [Anaerolineae bacterium]